ncbi:sugar transporter [Crocinitomicaceae bacterium CZZ-1]|uniref:Sugar transporter n=1 Tax=Taishania pollutisoli TaxID=2766479 RepID=A0A8J6PH04_9FLAO|nr:protein-disulfide reductase DsbD N-terminal domain-containing protein [Taishania pollutisoli]MBC9811481.1 sugar transporter [Taishania pollutisoli]MBX2948583.1 hypothetical protein [Crocinitomicaceae bacterium]NGF76320.1 sugar transporter [Fluviicola sp. SGL-29]
MKAFFLSLSTLLCFAAYTQQEITWDFSYNQEKEQVEMKASLAPGWHVYSTDLGGIAGPIPTEFAFEENDHVAIEGKVEEPQPKTEFDPNFEETVKYFDQQVTFAQRVNVKKNTSLKGGVVYMVCNDTMCLPPVEEKFEITLKK